MNRKDLFLKLYEELLDNGLIEESIYSDEYTTKREFIKIVEYVMEDYHILSQLKELN